MSQPTPPLHAEVRAAIEQELLKYGKMVTVYPGGAGEYIGQRYYTIDAILQAVAEALLAALPEKQKDDIPGVILNHAGESYIEGYNSALDAVTRVIGELGGKDD